MYTECSRYVGLSKDQKELVSQQQPHLSKVFFGLDEVEIKRCHFTKVPLNESTLHKKINKSDMT